MESIETTKKPKRTTARRKTAKKALRPSLRLLPSLAGLNAHLLGHTHLTSDPWVARL